MGKDKKDEGQVDILVYCKDCQSRNSWVRNPARDIKDINGKPIEYGYKCAVCGHTTLRPADKGGLDVITWKGQQ